MPTMPTRESETFTRTADLDRPTHARVPRQSLRGLRCGCRKSDRGADAIRKARRKLQGYRAAERTTANKHGAVDVQGIEQAREHRRLIACRERWWLRRHRAFASAEQARTEDRMARGIECALRLSYTFPLFSALFYVAASGGKSPRHAPASIAGSCLGQARRGHASPERMTARSDNRCGPSAPDFDGFCSASGTGVRPVKSGKPPPTS